MAVSVTNYPIDICLFLLSFQLVDKLMHVAEVAAAAAANGVHNLGSYLVRFCLPLPISGFILTV